jgi:transcriptional regulator with XRE-family HTH domain
MAHAGIKQVELARACGVQPPSVNGWLSGKAKFLRGENLLRAAQVLGVSQDWLATGKGSMAQPPRQEAGLSSSMKLTIETAAELRLLTVYRLADANGRGAIDDVVDVVQGHLDQVRAPKQA